MEQSLYSLYRIEIAKRRYVAKVYPPCRLAHYGRELSLLQSMNHPNIIKLKEVLLASEELHLVFEYLDTNLYEEYSKRKKEGRPFSETEIKNLLFQLASALMHMHKNGFFHRDLKP